ncbi:dienelactone hydrolase family protein [Halomonas nitroreducens]|uniref:Dienelactone hydrolase family protein n=1 Tax=Halomonas nitroreducens TaxID=447425 RepID=A0A431V3K3_9GAMM|nr:dienelactone hydrolase family protein [Halomonas nitroreducens]RTR02905.1 dienelactone hydrolase family protein [Halomonas nitroreducens]
MRHLFTLVCLAAGLMAGAAGVQAQTESSPGDEPVTIQSGPRVVGEVFEYATGGTSYEGYLARNANIDRPQPAVLVVHEWWGLDSYARARADQLAALGFVALAVDMYGNGQLAGHPGEAQEFSSRVMQDWPAARARLEAAMARLGEHPAVADGGMAAIGYCFGGSVVMNMALSGMPLEAAISFHGVPTVAVNMPQAFAGSVRIHNGAEDGFVAREDLVAMAEALTGQGADVKVTNYPGAQHGFTNPEADAFAAQHDLPLAYNAAADAASWQAALLTLDATLNDND